MIASVESAPLAAEVDTQSKSRGGPLPSQLSGVREIERLMNSLVATWNVSRGATEFRRWQRVPFDQQIQLTPLNDDTWEPVASPMVVTGSNISLGGLAFSHSELLPFRTVAVRFQSDEGKTLSMVTNLKWCRFGADRSFVSGGSFIGTTDRQDEFPDWDSLPQG